MRVKGESKGDSQIPKEDNEGRSMIVIAIRANSPGEIILLALRPTQATEQECNLQRFTRHVTNHSGGGYLVSALSHFWQSQLRQFRVWKLLFGSLPQ